MSVEWSPPGPDGRFPRQRKSQRETTAHHEAGHAVVAMRYRISFVAVTIEGKGHAAGGIIFDGPNGSLDISKLLEGRSSIRAKMAIVRHCLVATMAGEAAQKHFKARSWRHDHGAHDLAAADYLAKFLDFEGRSRDLLIRLHRELAQAEVKQLWPSIKAVAEALLRDDYLSWAAVRAITKETRSTKPASAAPAARRRKAPPRGRG